MKAEKRSAGITVRTVTGIKKEKTVICCGCGELTTYDVDAPPRFLVCEECGSRVFQTTHSPVVRKFVAR